MNPSVVLIGCFDTKGETFAHLRTNGDRGRAIDVMGRGAALLVRQLVHSGRVKAVVDMGSGSGTSIALAAMQAVPFGIPKLCLTTLECKIRLSHM